MNHLLLFFGSFGLALFLTWFVRGRAVANHWVSKPESDRHVHSVPLPRLGGVAIVLTFFGTTGVLTLISQVTNTRFGFPVDKWLGLLGPALLIFGVRLYDDIRNTSPHLKFVVQICGAIWLFANGYRIVHVPLLFGSRDLGFYLSLAMTVFWIVLITNAFNLIDGLDGLSAGSALFSTIVVFVIALSRGDFFVSMLSAALAGCILAFLRYNFHPATIFLGDSGSLFIGFVLGALGLASSQKSPTMIAVGIPVIACGFPVLDTGLSVVRRFMNGKPLFTGDREHIHHKLLALGFSQRKVVTLLYGVSALFASISLLLLNTGGRSLSLALVVVGTMVWIALQRVGYLEVSELGRVAQRTFEQNRIMANNLSVRRACERLKGCTCLSDICRALDEAFENNEFDRFEMRFPLPADGLGDFAPLRREQSDTGCYVWMKSSMAGMSLGSCWSLSLPLSSSRTWKQGSLVLFRICRPVPLRMDVNLVTSSLLESLSPALDRALANVVIPLPEIEDEDGSTAAAAAS